MYGAGQRGSISTGRERAPVDPPERVDGAEAGMEPSYPMDALDQFMGPVILAVRLHGSSLQAHDPATEITG